MKIGDEEVLTINQAAERIGICPGHVSVTDSSREVHADRAFGRQWMVPAGEVERYLEETKGKPGFAAETASLSRTAAAAKRRVRRILGICRQLIPLIPVQASAFEFRIQGWIVLG